MNKADDALWKDGLSLAIGLWLCSVPLVFFLAVTFFDLRVASVSVALSFIVILFVCLAICVGRLNMNDLRKP